MNCPSSGMPLNLSSIKPPPPLSFHAIQTGRFCKGLLQTRLRCRAHPNPFVPASFLPSVHCTWTVCANTYLLSCQRTSSSWDTLEKSFSCSPIVLSSLQAKVATMMLAEVPSHLMTQMDQFSPPSTGGYPACLVSRASLQCTHTPQTPCTQITIG